MTFAALLALSYLSGALPWSVWLGKRFFRVDPRSKADGNPGAANAFRVGGWALGATVLLLDFFKACIPVLVARRRTRLSESQMFWVALMPTAGHAFSIFLRFRGGRALAALFGVWAALTLYEAPLVMGSAATIATLRLKSDEQRALAIPTTLIVYLVLRRKPFWMPALGVAQLLILLSKVGAFYLSAAPPADRPSRAPT